MTFQWIVVVLVFLVTGAGALYGFSPDSRFEEGALTAADMTPDRQAHDRQRSERGGLLVPDWSGRVIDELAVDWLERYGETIQDPAVQARFAGLRKDVLLAYPDQGEGIFLRALWLAFPSFAQEILTLLARLQEYQQWLLDNDLQLRDMPVLTREGAKWQKRLQLFGPDAELIWADEKLVWAERKQAVQQTMEALNQASEYSLDETLFQLQAAIAENYGSSWQGLVMDNGVVANVFFGFESVQSRLRALPQDQRQQQINRVRSSLGYSDEQVRRLAERDQRRNQRWENGLAYMEARAALTQSLTGNELATALSDLQTYYFRHEAVTIAQEEADGFFRYRRPRYFGRN